MEDSLDRLKHRLCRSDRDAFEHVFRHLSPRVFRFVRRMTGSETLAYDVTQDTFAKLWTARATLSEIDSLRGSIFQMARHRVYNTLRDERVRRDNEEMLHRDDLDTAPPAPDAQLDAEQLRDLLDQWIGDLPPRQREALTLRRIDGLSHEAIANLMDISPHTVNNHIVRAMDRLRDRLRAHRPDLLA
jgi:RNA polymerase sigma-70 factor (ECF subfamily)